MRTVVQRVTEARVRVDGEIVGQCGRGFLLLVGVHRNDTPAAADHLADRVAGMRILSDAEGRMNLSLAQVDPPGEILAVSNFTVYGDANSGRRPSFTASAPYEAGKSLFEQFVAGLRSRGIHVETGVFGADMAVELINDGPVTLVVDSAP